MPDYKGVIIVLEGADGVGKSTLANTIAERIKGSVLHQTYNKDWNMEEYHTAVFACALMLAHYRPMILDRWCPSEYVYGNVFRDGPSFDVENMMFEADGAAQQGNIKMVYVYCRNDNVVENHKKNSKKRVEMFDTMEKVQEEFDAFTEATGRVWYKYDFNKNGSGKKLQAFIDVLVDGVEL